MSTSISPDDILWNNLTGIIWIPHTKCNDPLPPPIYTENKRLGDDGIITLIHTYIITLKNTVPILISNWHSTPCMMFDWNKFPLYTNMHANALSLFSMKNVQYSVVPGRVVQDRTWWKLVDIIISSSLVSKYQILVRFWLQIANN